MDTNQADINKKENENKENASPLSDIGSGVLDIVDIVLGSSPKKGKSATDAADESGVFDGISETISTVKDAIVDNSGEVLESAAKIAGDIAGGIADAIGDIDL
ncbi:hypothetical protein D0T84_19190 [Dysgonomonas sp. 521]|uniref:hypothetical protein n=1 Tax=Dysgonomonas sp. 521 TaxID=2302932 RepID=UPI0013D6A78C|nr:hypothetical protein [Dysgonomonas sp. 521]NDV97016.1 hypothetical protein [Dysgonomonas sp. 521]